MTYIDAINKFWRLTRGDPCSMSETALYFYILNVWNDRGRLNPVVIKTSDIEAWFKISRGEITKLRKSLERRGFLKISGGAGNRSPYYEVCEIDEKNEQKSDKKNGANVTSNAPPNVRSANTNQRGNVRSANTNAPPNVRSANINTLYIDKESIYNTTTSKDVVSGGCCGNIEMSLFPEEKKSKKKSPAKPKEPRPDPTLDEILSYFETHAKGRLAEWETSARLFYDSYSATGWVNKYGRKVVRWDSEANKWIFYQEQREKENAKTKPDAAQRGGLPPSVAAKLPVKPECGILRRPNPKK